MDFDDVVSAAEGVRTGQVSARELVQRSLDRIAERDEPLNAFVHVDGAGALEAADRVDAARRAGEELGPLAGVPFGVKDLEDCAGMPPTRGSRWYADAGPVTHDDIHVARFRAAGAIPIGKTATPEFGAWGYTASPLLGVTFGLDASGQLWVRRPDGKLMETQRQIWKRAEAEAKRAEAEAQRAEAEATKSARLAAKLREMGIDPDAL